MEKKPYHHGNLEEALIEAGLSLVDREGLEAMSLRRVASACGVSHAAPYKHFDSKAGLLSAMQRHVENRFAQVLEASGQQPEAGEDRLMRMGQAYIRFFMEKPHYFSFFQRQQGDLRVNLADMNEESNYRPFEVFKTAAKMELEPLQLPVERQRQTIIAMWAIVHGCTSISVMRGVLYDGDWAALLGSILEYNLGVGGMHFDGQNSQSN